ncbi:hypothetical protein [Mycolicibacterium sp. P1-5]|uniref:hypothetical protein n=1 Tax=Mycolicibacterium sp. P1-5 TaxID=2024617 RepID=UPI0011EBC70F|nr:hypothetical protein [Mycolicibacterium sp. P1-5]KAA0103796.1 hypothetical protein CIW47_22455 [Mycolicibacterium sp. P1-5]
MSIHAPVRPTPRAVDTQPTMLITEHEVRMLTAATVAPAAGAGMVSRWIAARRAAHHARVDHQCHTAHYEFLEYAAMARAMEHL